MVQLPARRRNVFARAFGILGPLTASLTMRFVACPLVSRLPQFESHEPGQQSGWIELTDNAFDIAKASGNRMDRNDVAVSR